MRPVSESTFGFGSYTSCSLCQCSFMIVQDYIKIACFFLSAGALIFGCTVALCFLIRDLMFYVIGEFCLEGTSHDSRVSRTLQIRVPMLLQGVFCLNKQLNSWQHS